jgi:hypothetical protein
VVIELVTKQIESAIVKEEHNKLIEFCVATGTSLCKMFATLEKIREEQTNLIEDYTISQVTLDDVFVSFSL